jgi:hypothetical protein
MTTPDDVAGDMTTALRAWERELGPAQLRHAADGVALALAEPFTLSEVLQDVSARREHIARGEALDEAAGVLALLESELSGPLAALQVAFADLAADTRDTDWAADVVGGS